jgi:hypothetical protein
VSNQLRPFTSMERAFRQLLLDKGLIVDGTPTPVTTAVVGGSYRYDPETMDWYIRIDQVPGGSSNWFDGDFVLDVEVFGREYLVTENVAFAIEALALGYPHVVEVDGRKVVLGEVSQNVGVSDLPWEDDSVYRLGATYVITARRR